MKYSFSGDVCDGVMFEDGMHAAHVLVDGNLLQHSLMCPWKDTAIHFIFHPDDSNGEQHVSICARIISDRDGCAV